MAATGPPAQASFNPTKILEGRAQSCAYQLNGDNGAQGSMTLHGYKTGPKLYLLLGLSDVRPGRSLVIYKLRN